jgi:hypothetical protein
MTIPCQALKKEGVTTSHCDVGWDYELPFEVLSILSLKDKEIV